MHFKIYLILLFAWPIACLAQEEDHTSLLKECLPDWALQELQTRNTFSTYSIADFINPFYLEGDFNADHKVDIAILLEEKSTHKKGFMILHNGKDEPVLFGAGHRFENGSDDYSWLDIWKVYRNEKAEPGINENKTIYLIGDGLWIGESESSSALIYWTGKTYKWSQQKN